jgi:hypothetical protein
MVQASQSALNGLSDIFLEATSVPVDVQIIVGIL